MSSVSKFTTTGVNLRINESEQNINVEPMVTDRVDAVDEVGASE